MRFKIAAAVAAISVLALSAVPAQASLIETDNCDGSTLTQPFAPWGDNAYYKLGPGGDFSSAAHGWTLRNGARVDSGVLTLPAGASATMPATCVNAGHPKYRFFSKSSGGLLGLVPLMKVDLVYRDNLLGLVALPLGLGTPSRTWQPSLPMVTLAEVASLVDGGEASLSLRFTSASGTWSVDDVFVDPYNRG